MKTSPRVFLALSGALALTLAAPRAYAADPAPIRIAVLTDMSGIYANATGRGSVEAVKMAVDDFGGKVLGRPVVVETIDHRNNPAEGAAKLRESFDGGTVAVFDLTNSAVALAASTVAKEKHRLAFVTGAGTTDLYGVACSKYTYDYGFDTYSLAHSVGSDIASKPDGKTWYVIAPNYAFGKAMLASYGDAIRDHGGTLLHSDLVPSGTTDFSAYLLAAKNAHPQVLGILNAGSDAETATKQARLFGLDKQMKLALGYISTTEIDAVPEIFAGALLAQNWFWTKDAPSRAWAQRFAKRMDGHYPSDVQVADYSAATQWLKAVAATGTTDADALVRYLDGRQFNDFYAVGGEWRARDHRVIHEVYVLEILGKDAAREPHGWYKLRRTVAPGIAFAPENTSTCKKDW